MELSEFIQRVTTVLRDEQIDHFLTGSVAAMVYGEPRLTIDVDIVVRLDEQSARRLLAHFPAPEWYVSEVAALDAVRRHGQFNLIHPTSGLKADLMVSAGDEFDASRFARARRLALVSGALERVASPEDVVLKKLSYFALGESEKHVQDIARILRTQGDAIDWGYLRRWAARHQTDGILNQILRNLGDE